MSPKGRRAVTQTAACWSQEGERRRRRKTFSREEEKWGGNNGGTRATSSVRVSLKGGGHRLGWRPQLTVTTHPACSRVCPERPGLQVSLDSGPGGTSEYQESPGFSGPGVAALRSPRHLKETEGPADSVRGS